MTGPDPASMTTSGDQSPIVSNVIGSVVINYGLPPEIAAVLARQLRELEENRVEIGKLREEAEQFARRYRELEERLRAQSGESELARRSRELLEQGKLQEAGEALDELIRLSGEDLASHCFSRAQLFELQFQRPKALPFYKKDAALSSSPKYNFAYA